MKSLEEMKKYIKEQNKTHLVRELVEGIDYPPEKAIEEVYDHLTLTKEEYVRKYFILG